MSWLPRRGCGQLEDMRLRCPRLTALDCSYCQSLTDRGLESLVDGCPRVDTLSLSVCSRVGSRGLRCLQRLAGLRKLDLSYTELQVCTFCPDLPYPLPPHTPLLSPHRTLHGQVIHRVVREIRRPLPWTRPGQFIQRQEFPPFPSL